MDTKSSFYSAGILCGLAAMPVLLFAHSYGPPPGLTAGPGDDPRSCTSCHGGTALNAGGGKVEIILPNGPNYTPGVTQRIGVRVTDDPARRWGFQFSARLAIDPANSSAGSLMATPGVTQLYCSNYTPTSTGTPLPCPAGAIQFISHVAASTRNGLAGPTTFEFDWTPPDTDQGPVNFYAAGNAANGNGSPSGDHIYTTASSLTFAAAKKPAVTQNGIVSAASYKATAVAAGTWITIYGTDLASSTRLWASKDFVGGALPTSLDGVSVTVNGKAGFVEYVSPGQLNVLTPDDRSTGPVQVQVKTLGGAADPATITLQTTAPALFTFDGTVAASTHVDGTLIGAPGLFPAAPAATTPAKPGETVVFYGSGFGATNPATSTGALVTQVSPLAATDLSITIGGASAKISFAGLIPNNAGLYQFNVEVPATAPDGDLSVVATVGGFSSAVAGINVKK